MRHVVVFAAVSILAFGCAADAAPLESDAVVVSAGAASPVPAGTRCVLRMQPAFRQGVNCQVLLRCDEGSEAEHDLFGGRRIGGYAVCEAADHAFLSAHDGEPSTDGDPAVHVDVTAGTITWRGRRAEETAELRIEGPPRLAAAW
jgi:hypothetical protein